MILISNKGLTTGPNERLENSPEQVLATIHEGYDVKIDVWFENRSWYLGSSKPQYEVEYNFLLSPQLWINCKDVLAASYLAMDTRLNSFVNNPNSYTLTSRGLLWDNSYKYMVRNAVFNMPEWQKDWETAVIPKLNGFGICSDYISDIKDMLY